MTGRSAGGRADLWQILRAGRASVNGATEEPVFPPMAGIRYSSVTSA